VDQRLRAQILDRLHTQVRAAHRREHIREEFLRHESRLIRAAIADGGIDGPVMEVRQIVTGM
jgi:hypothetical protein